MFVKVPFVFAASIIPAKCQKPRVQYLRGEAGVTIADLSEAKLAASWEVNHQYSNDRFEYQVFHGHGSFWEALTRKRASRMPEHHVSLDEWLELISVPSASGNPFGGHRLASLRDAQRSYKDLPTRQTVREEMPIREYLGDDGFEEEKAIFESAMRYGVRNGRMYVKRDEPVYVVRTFGLGGDHGGTSLMVDGESASGECDGRNLFRLAERDKAVQRATEVAERRQDRLSLPAAADVDVKIHSPEVFTFAAFGRSRLESGKISLRDYAINGCEPTERLNELINQVSIQIADRINKAGTEHQVDWLIEQNVDPETLLACFAKSESS